MVSKKTWIIIVLIIVAIILVTRTIGKPDYNQFAQCLSDKAAKVFIGEPCPECDAQKEMFGEAWENIKILGCSESHAKGVICNFAGVRSFPTWEFADGSRIFGKLSFETLSQETGCPLP